MLKVHRVHGCYKMLGVTVPRVEEPPYERGKIALQHVEHPVHLEHAVHPVHLVHLDTDYVLVC